MQTYILTFTYICTHQYEYRYAEPVPGVVLAAGFMYVCMYMCVCVYVCMYACMYLCMLLTAVTACVSVYIYIYIYIYVYVYIYNIRCHKMSCLN